MSKKASYRQDLDQNSANYVPLSPVSFLARSARAFPEKIAVVDGDRRFTYREFQQRCLRLASALERSGVQEGDTVAVLAPNVTALLEAHYGVPMLGAVLNALNTRLDAASIAFCLGHGEAKIVLVDAEFVGLIDAALAAAGLSIPVVVIALEPTSSASQADYEAFLMTGDPAGPRTQIADEWTAITLGYTSGTTGDPKGVVCHHRGAYLNALGNALAARLEPEAVYLWTLPMFHCNGWSHTWAVTAVGGTHVCLRKVEPVRIFELIEREKVTHMSAAPVVLNMLAHAPEIAGLRFDWGINILTGGSAPPTAVMTAMEGAGFNVMHIYGLTESTGPSLICEWHQDWNGLPLQARMQLNARQGVNLVTLEDAMVADPDSCSEVPSDGATMGEIMLRGSTIMMGYLKNPSASAKAFAGGWFHTGDLAVRHPDGYIEIKDRAKDVIISGGENISSVEIEEILYRHPAILEAAVVSRPDPKWGEHPCAFVSFKEGATPPGSEELTEYCRANLARFKVPKTFVFGTLPKTSTGKIQKFLLRRQAQALT
ncbi:AMP-binding protein [Pseudaminobacter sp. 19-2017]|uniref:3-methylmercaptopropionyl-CoA ligase n=1 Tax=Pseudaminobacter soli (ex Zhang et al. 2022) TaxID=2831468 RepID=A0A942E5L6_9HYPH|nr:AMP-binding protein [Pseudaminobacter soli]